MKRNNLWITGLAAAIITVVSLNLILARNNLANNRVFGYNHWRHHNHYCNDYDRENSDKARESNRLRPDTTNY